VRNEAAGLKGRAISGPHGSEQIAAIVECSRQRVADFYGDFEARLKEAEFVAGDRFSAAEITMPVTVEFATKPSRCRSPTAVSPSGAGTASRPVVRALPRSRPV
jgi:glutathione S-transferase